jgi:Bacterial Ig domain
MVALLLGASFAVALVLAPRAHAFVYWANFGTNPAPGTTIGRAGTDGGSPNQGFITGADRPCGVAVDGTHIYWGNDDGTIGRANLDGNPASVDQDFITGGDSPCGVAVNGTHVYWANGNPTNSIGRANINGNPASVDQDFITGTDNPCGVDLDGAHVYWANNGVMEGDTIGRADLDGATVDHDFVQFVTPTSPCGVAVNSTNVYWANTGTGNSIGRAALSDQVPHQDFITGLSGSCGVAVDAAHIYWAAGGNSTTVGRADLDGDPTSVNEDFITGANSPCGVAVNFLSVPSCQSTSASTRHAEPVGITLSCTSGGAARTFSIVSQPPHGEITGFNASTGKLTYTPDDDFHGSDGFTFTAHNPGATSNTAEATIAVGAASNEFTIGKAKRNKKKGTAKLPVTVPGAGSLELAKSKKVKSDTEQAQGAGTVKLLVKAKGKARKKLKAKGKAKVRVGVTFSPTGGDPATQDASVKLKRKR